MATIEVAYSAAFFSGGPQESASGRKRLNSQPCDTWIASLLIDAIVGGHHAVTAVDLGIVEAGMVDARLQLVGDDQARNAVE